MKREWKLYAVCFILFSFTKTNSDAQTQIGGVINSYWPVSSVDICNNRVALPLIAVGINIGDKVLLIQMQGASIDTSDTPSYGSITNYNDAGNYELLIVSDVTNNIITFQEIIIGSYDPAGKVQMVLVPQYTDVDVAATLTAQPWNGSTGGVLAFMATGTVTMNADINASGIGFRGGAVLHDPFCYGGGIGYDGYRCNTTLMGGATKGEGIAGNLFQNLARGGPANGGGGGNDSNTGGGGGSNSAGGGLGGQRINTSAGCAGDNPGIGGYALDYSNVSNKIFLGGGGGAGDDNTNGATAGGNGGGIILIRANSIVNNGFTIMAKGTDVATVALSDGAGGGGSGGAVLLDVSSLTGVDMNVSGGLGGSADGGAAAIDSCFGPGGGGGSGIIWASGATIPPGNLLMNGGTSGISIGVSCGGTNGATDGGSTASALTGLTIPESTVIFVPLTLTVSSDTTICLGEDALLYASGTGTGALTFQWSDGQMGDSILVSPTAQTTYDITLTDSRGCSITKTVTVDVMSNSVTAFAFPDSMVLGYGTIQLSADTAGNEFFQWDPPTWLNDPASSNPIAIPEDTVTYCVIATGYNGCKDTACVDVLVVVPEPALFIPTGFTPNNDGLNDTWHIIANDACYTLEVVRVWNRWGMLVYDLDAWSGAEWNGTMAGAPQAMETYFYYIQAKCSERNEDEEYYGSLTLIR